MPENRPHASFFISLIWLLGKFILKYKSDSPEEYENKLWQEPRWHRKNKIKSRLTSNSNTCGNILECYQLAKGTCTTIEAWMCVKSTKFSSSKRQCSEVLSISERNFVSCREQDIFVYWHRIRNLTIKFSINCRGFTIHIVTVFYVIIFK